MIKSEICRAYDDFVAANEASHNHQLWLIDIERRWKHLHRPMVSVFGGAPGLRQAIRSVVGATINITSSLFGPSAEEKEEMDRERDALLLENEQLIGETDEHNKRLLAAIDTLRECLIQGAAEFPNLLEAYHQWQSAGTADMAAGLCFLNVMGSWRNSI